MPESIDHPVQPDTIAVIIPIYNEGKNLPDLLQRISQRQQVEIIFVDGGSSDNSVELVRGSGHQLVLAARGRARQMNAGAQRASADVLLFLHADTQLPESWPGLVVEALQDAVWGRFDVIIDGVGPAYNIIAFMMNWRSRLTGIATGDQALFMRRELFLQLGGYAEIALMEDIELTGRLRRYGRAKCLRQKVVTSARRWQQKGVVKTVILMWWLRLAYWLGVSPDKLVQWYR